MSALLERYRLVLLLVVLPLLLAAASLWQLARTPSLAEIRQADAVMQNSIDQLERFIKEQGQGVSVEVGEGQQIRADLLVNEIRERQASFWNSELFRRELPLSLSWVGLLAGGGAALCAVLGLLGIKRAGRRSLLSREELLRSFRRGAERLPWLLAVIALAVGLALACLICFELLHFLPRLLESRGGTKFAVTCGLICIAILVEILRLQWRLFKASRQVFDCSPIFLTGKSLSREAAPKLWSFVREIAERAKTNQPDTIIVGLDEGFFVTEHPVQLCDGTQLPKGRVLYLPLPFLAFMNKPEVAAVIGHELGHFVGADTEYSLRLSPVLASSAKKVESIDRGDASGDVYSWLFVPAMSMGAFFLASFELAVLHWSRERELAADRFGSALTSRETFASALLRVSVLAPRVSEALALCREHGGALRGGVLAQMRRLIDESGLDDPRSHLEDKQAHPIDSHPTAFQRLEALGVAIDENLLGRARDRQGSAILQELGLAGEIGEESAIGEADEASVCQALESEFSDAARRELARKRSFLEGLAAHGREPLPCHETVALRALLMLVVAAGCAFSAYRIAIQPLVDKQHLALALGAAIVLSFVAINTLIRGRVPLMTLNERGILLPGLDSELPWTGIANFNFEIQRYALVENQTLTIILAEGQKLPAGGHDRRVRCDGKKHQIVLRSGGFRKLKAKVFCEKLNAYWRGGLARAELRNLPV